MFRHSLSLAYLSWGTVFGILWLLLLDVIPLDGLAWGAWSFSLFIAFFSSMGSR